MGRSSTAQIGHNAELTDDDKAALQQFHSRQIRIAIAEAEKIAAAARAAKKTVNNRFAALKGDLGISRQDFEEVLALEDLTEAEFVLKEQARTKRLSLQGLPVGTQLDMFGSGDTVDELARARVDGQRACRRGDFGTPPDHISPVCVQAWMEGYNDELNVIAGRMARAEAIIAEREEAKNAAEASSDEDDADETEDEEFDEEAEARKLQRSGFMDRTEASAEAELADA